MPEDVFMHLFRHGGAALVDKYTVAIGVVSACISVCIFLGGTQLLSVRDLQVEDNLTQFCMFMSHSCPLSHLCRESNVCIPEHNLEYWHPLHEW